ncbi:hypothetical protein ARMSODRAFT_973912 [Armillaria solidipes]|uniref:Uncharacterized protein n=1 Tax=Armillaria solidipes TaxID=1076256 RepID=A0A2H3C5K7_9AGAR|nr:hypothetical protein ARMSODRAFT_973912 [Armillaria solidipes]
MTGCIEISPPRRRRWLWRSDSKWRLNTLQVLTYSVAKHAPELQVTDIAELKQLEVDEGRDFCWGSSHPGGNNHIGNIMTQTRLIRLFTPMSTVTVSDLTQLDVIHSTYPAHKVAEHYTASEKHFLRGDIYVWDSSIMAIIASGCRPGGPTRSN